MNDRSEAGFVRAMARELLVYNPSVKTVADAISLATELIHSTKTHTYTGDINNERLDAN